MDKDMRASAAGSPDRLIDWFTVPLMFEDFLEATKTLPRRNQFECHVCVARWIMYRSTSDKNENKVLTRYGYRDMRNQVVIQKQRSTRS